MDVDDLHALMTLGRDARLSGDHLTALVHFQAVADHLPQDIWRKLDVAAELTALERFAEAERVHDAILALEPGNPQSLIALGQTARRRGDHEVALAHFQTVADHLPQDIWRKLDVIEELRSLGRLDEARIVYEAILALEPGNPQALIALGQGARRAGDHAAALAYFQTAAEHLPRDIWRKLDVIEELSALGRLDEAESLYRVILILDRDCLAAKVGLGQMIRRRNGAEAALAFFQAAALEEPGATWPHLEAATDLRALGRLVEADAKYGIVLTSDPNDLYALIGRGHCAGSRNDHDIALAYFKMAADSAPLDPWPKLEMARAHRELGDHDTARQIAGALLASDPDDLQALLSLAETERHAGRGDDAYAVLGRAQRAHPHHADLILEMARAEHRSALHAECDAHLQMVLSSHPFHPGAVQLWTERLIARNDMEAARAAYEQASSARPDEPLFQLGLLTVLCHTGQADEAIASVEALQRRGEASASFLVRLIMMLRQAGRYHEALSTAVAASEAHPRNFWIFLERFHTELLFDDEAAIETCLNRMQESSSQKKAILERSWGLFEENRRRLPAAIARYENAAALDPLDPSPLNDLARVKMMVCDFAGARGHLTRVAEREAHYNALRQRSQNRSQTFYGQILNDFSLDSTLARAFEAAQGLPPPARVNLLRLIARQNPDNTMAAVSLLLAMREAGVFDRPAEGEGGIPRMVTQFWDTVPPPDDIRTLMETWRDVNPGYEMRCLDSRAAVAFLAEHCPPPVLQAFNRCREIAQKADIFRLAWLVERGGIYVDADDRCLQPLDGVLPAGARLVLYQEDLGTLANDVIAAAPRHPVMAKALDLAVAAINRGDREIAWLSTGPGLITRAFVQVMLHERSDSLPPGTVVLDRRHLHRFIAVHCSVGYKKTNRHWLNSSFPQKSRIAVGI